MRTLDLLVLLSFGVSLAFFNRGDVFESAALAVPPLVYLAVRTAWIGFRATARRGSTAVVWPVWALAVATLFLVGFRVGLNVDNGRSVIDVGYAGVIGADRILDGRVPYGTMPVTDDLKPCGRADSDGEIRERIQANGRCESSNPRGDTYGPVAYLAYVPAVLVFGWSGRWDELPAAHATSIEFDLLALAGLALVGARLGGARLAALLAFGWAAFPFTTYALMSNTNDAIAPAILVWGFWLASSPAARGATTALASWTKFAPLIVVPLWLTYPSGLRRRAEPAVFVAGVRRSPRARVLDPPARAALRDALRAFWDRTVAFQFDRDSPFSIWDWGQYHARGIPDLASAQTVVQVCTIVARRGRRGAPAPEGRRSSSPRSRRAPARVRALADPLVLPLPPLGAAVRRCSRCSSRASRTSRTEAGFDVERRRAVTAATRSSPLRRRSSLTAVTATVAWQLTAARSPTSRSTTPTASASRTASSRTATSHSSIRPARCRRSCSRRSSPTPSPPSASCSPRRWLAGAVGVLLLAAGLGRLGTASPTVASRSPSSRSSPLLLGGVILTRFDLVPAAIVAGAMLLLVAGRLRAGALRRRHRNRGEALPGRSRAARRGSSRGGAADGASSGRSSGSSPPVLASRTFRSSSRRRTVCSTRRAVSSAGRCRSRASARRMPARRPPRRRHLARVGVGAAARRTSPGPAPTRSRVLQGVAQVAAVVLVWVSLRARRRDPERLVRYAAAALVAFVALGKVLSPQFLIWLLPLVPLVRGRRGVAPLGLLSPRAS